MTPVSFNLDATRNRLLSIFPSKKYFAGIGKFDGRAETRYALRQPENSVFAFVIDGVFEVQNRLLHPRDGLLLQGLDTVEIEALSGEAIIMVLEV